MEIGESHAYGSHDFRRGAAKDVLDKEGLQAMIQAGDWHSPAMQHYVSTSEIEEKLLWDTVLQWSEDEA